jgi:hypothetical protein
MIRSEDGSLYAFEDLYFVVGYYKYLLLITEPHHSDALCVYLSTSNIELLGLLKHYKRA